MYRVQEITSGFRIGRGIPSVCREPPPKIYGIRSTPVIFIENHFATLRKLSVSFEEGKWNENEEIRSWACAMGANDLAFILEEHLGWTCACVRENLPVVSMHRTS